jgi:hypothetical protein
LLGAVMLVVELVLILQQAKIVQAGITRLF